MAVERRSDPVPGRWWYLVPALIVAATALAVALFLVDGIPKIAAGLTRVDVPGRAELDLSAGTYTIFREYQPAEGGVVTDGGDLTGLEVQVTGPAGSPVTIEPASGSRYTAGGRSGYSIMAFDAPEDGRYRLAAAYPDGADAPRGVLAIGSGFVTGILLTVFGGLAIAALGTALALLAGRAVYRRRQVAAA